MLLLLRVVLVALMALMRLLRGGLGQPERRAGRPFFVKINKHKGAMKSFELATPTRLAARFSFDREGKLDRWLRAVGLVTELQTNDRRFDDHVFVACDDEGVHSRLKSSPELRVAISRVLNTAGDRVDSDGKHLRLVVATDVPPSSDDFTRLQQIVTLIETARGQSRRIDPFFGRVIAVEVAIGLLLVYGIGGVIALWSRTARVDLYLSIGDIARASLATGTGLLIFALVFLALVVRGSSRAWRIASDGLLMLMFAVPTAAVALAVDLNEHLDTQPVVVPVRIERLHSELHRGSKGSTWYTWHARLAILDGNAAPMTVPDAVEISERTSDALHEGAVVNAVIGRGALGAPYWIALGP